MYSKARPALFVLLLVAPWVGTAAAETLFRPLSVMTRAQADRAPAMQRLLVSPATATAQEVQLDATAVDSTHLEFELLGRPVQAQRTRVETLPDGSTVWYGRLRDNGRRWSRASAQPDPMDSVILVRSGDTVTASIRKEGQLYRLRPVGRSRHVLVEVDEARVPAEHSVGDEPLPVVEMGEGSTLADTRPTPIRVLVVATRAAVEAYGGDLQPVAQLAVAETNQGYANSRIGVRLQLAGFETTEYAQTGIFQIDLTRFRGTRDGYMDDIHRRRDAVAADVAILLTDEPVGECGQASGIGSTPATAFAAVAWSCATGLYSFAHEIGHLQGARHDVQMDPAQRPYPYGHGYRYEPNSGAAWRTIMAYDCARACPRVNYWSNPDVSYRGISMGIPEVADNHRVLMQTWPIIAGFR